jgi:DNA-binding XRE family transcriptional regulator
VNRLREHRAVARVRHGPEFHQEALAKRMGVTRQTLAAWEKGTSQPTITQAVKLAQLLGVSVDDLGYGVVD